MTNKQNLFQQKIAAALLIGTAAAAIAFGLATAGWLDELEWKSFDLRVRLARAETPPPPEIAVILIDEASLRMMNARVGRWPWPRSLHADVVDFLAAAGARRIVFDILFTENERNVGVAGQELSENDARLAGAVASAGNVVSAVQLVRDDPDEYNHGLLNRPLPPEFSARFALPGVAAAGKQVAAANTAYLPYAELAASSHDIGVVEFAPDRDGIYRRTRLIRTYGEEAFPTLSLAALSDRWQPVAAPGKWLHLRPRDSAAEGIDLPLGNNGEYLIKPYKDFRAYSMSGVLLSIHQLRQGEIENLPVSPEEFRDKIVLIGASAVGVEDLKPTPFGTLQPGVLLHASIIGNILHHDFLHTPPAWVLQVTTLLLPILMALAVLLPARTGWRIIAPITLALAFLAAGQRAFESQWVVEMVAPWTGITLAWIGSFARLSATEGREKRRIRKMFGQYVSPAVLESIADNAAQGLLQAEVGRREHLTILFSDIRGFTSLSEAMEPEQVVEILNGYFTGMVDIIFLRQGTLDKFIGDAIMAFWGAPLRIDDHALQGVTAAMEMARWLEIYNKNMQLRNLPPIAIGIGLHTGPMILGNIGSEKKLDYTVIGDNVNLSSRLEGLTKIYGCQVLISATTQQEAGAGIICRVLDHVRVKGKSQPIRIYEVLALATDAAAIQSRAQQQAELTAAAFARYLARDWVEALQAYAGLLEIRSDDPLARLFIDRCQHYQQESPPPDWDGVFTMKTK
jgi:adenylate cyclase